MNARRILVNLAVWLAMALLVGLFGAVRKWHVYSLFRHPAVAHGTVGQEMGKSFELAYTVEKKIYHATKFRGPFYPRTGDSITVYYDKTNPENCTVFEPKVDLFLTILGIAVQCALFPFLVMLLLHYYKLLPEWKLFKVFRLG